MKTRILQGFILLLCSICLSRSAFAQVDPLIEWKVWRLPHFDLVFDAKHQDLAKVYATHLENNRQALSQYFELLPEKTLVVLNDKTDLTNGFATPIPQRLVMIYPVLPGPMESIGEFGNWAKEITLHEYAHVLSFEPKRGFVKILSYIYGSVINTNLLLPRWWLEGVAVDMETRNSSHGRLRSSLQEASLRAMALSGQLKKVTLAEINETSIHTWPQGARPYLFGSLVWSEIIQEKKPAIISQLHWRYGGRIPFFIEGPAQDMLDGPYDDMFARAIQETLRRTENQNYKLQAAPFSQLDKLGLSQFAESFTPVVSPDGLKLILLTKNETTRRSMQILKRADLTKSFQSGDLIKSVQSKNPESSSETAPSPRIVEEAELEDAPPGGTIQRMSWFPDSQKFVFDKVEAVNQFHENSDLHIYDLEKGKARRLTKGLRAREPSVSGDGSQIVFVKLDVGTTGLSVIDVDGKSPKDLYLPTEEVRISYPIFWTAREIAFVERKQGKDSLWFINTETLQRRQMLKAYSNINFIYRADSRLYFTSNQNGVMNLYVSEDALTAKPLTHSATGIFTTSFDSQLSDFYVTEMTDKGFEVKLLSAKQIKNDLVLPKIEGLFADRYPPPEPTQNSFVANPESIESYHAYEHLFPQYWFPYVTFDSNSYTAALSTSAGDPLAKHLYSLDLAYDSKTKQGSLLFQYINATTTAKISAIAADYYSSILSGSVRVHNQNYYLNSLWDLNEISTSLSSSLGWTWSTRGFTSTSLYRQGPTWKFNYQDYAMAGAQISPESGWAASLMATHFSETQSLSRYNRYNFLVQNYFSKWLPKRHSIFWRMQGLYIAEDVSLSDFDTHSSFALFANNPAPTFILRGYPAGYFVGKTMNNMTLEYRAPLKYLYRGAGTTPLFLKRLHIAGILDGLLVDGFDSRLNRVDRNHVYLGSGIELKLDITLGFHIPATLVWGLYRSEDKEVVNNEQIISFQSN